MKSRNYDREFKLNAMKLYKNSSKKAREVSMDLGIPESTFSTWVKEYHENGEKSFRGSGKIKSSNEEVYRLKKELRDAQMERDILKKALAIFSQKK